MQDQNDLGKKILAWLDTQGYPLEMKVAHTFQSADFRVIQSEYYKDGETSESREIDILAFQQEETDDGLLVRVSIIGECKSSKDKPWILFSSEECALADPGRVAQRAASVLGRRVLMHLAEEREIQDLPILQIPEMPTYSLTQAFTSGNDICYSAAAAVSDAAAAIAAEASDRKRGSEIIEIIFPVIFTEAKLFSVWLQEDSSLAIKEVQSGVLLWRNPLVGLPHTIVHVISINALEQFVAEAHASVQKLFGMLLNTRREVIPQVLDYHRRMEKSPRV